MHIVEALEMAISALQAQDLQQACNNLATDTISRREAIDAVCMEWCGVKHQDCKHPFDVKKDDYYWCDGCETALQTLPDLPSAQPETARRIVGKSRGGMTLWYQCDMCNEPVDAQDSFCRGCGRRFCR